MELRKLFPFSPLLIAGPCSAETPEQTLGTARALAANGVKIFRAGVWKPRTKPGGFEGIGVPALDWLRRVKEETGMLTATEVGSRAHVEAALNAGVDVLWIGARTSANPFVMQEIADTLAERDTDVAVLVKNPVNPDLELWIGALQRIHAAGIRRLGAIHRGFSVYGSQVFRNAPCWNIPTALRLRYPELPILCDPSHMGGKRELIAPLAQQSLDMGFDGLIVECHCDPDNAWSDAAQQITPESLALIVESLVVRDKTANATESLASMRRRIDEADTELLDVLARRMAVSRDIGRFKKDHAMPVVQAHRYNDVMTSRIQRGESLGLGAEFLKSVLLAIHDESVRQQLAILKDD